MIYGSLWTPRLDVVVVAVVVAAAAVVVAVEEDELGSAVWSTSEQCYDKPPW